MSAAIIPQLGLNLLTPLSNSPPKLCAKKTRGRCVLYCRCEFESDERALAHEPTLVSLLNCASSDRNSKATFSTAVDVSDVL